MKETEKKISRLLDVAPHTFCLLDSELNIIDINISGVKKWGMGNFKKKDVVGKNILNFVPEAKITGRYQKLLEVLKTGKPYIMDAMPVHPKFGKKFVNFIAMKVGHGLGIIITDVTERQKAKDALSESESRYRLLVESMNEGLVMLDEKGMVTYINDRFPEVLGINREEIIGHSVMEFVDPADQKILKQQMRRRSKGKRGTYEIELQKKDGEKIMVFVSGRPIFDEKGNFKGSIAVLTDITNIRLAEQELNKSREQLRNLSLYLQSIREEERKLLSREIHDELGQLLTALKMDLSWLSKRISRREGNQELLLEKARSMSELLNKTMKSVQRISSELRPGLLDDLGLLPALEWQAQEFENRTKIKCEVSLQSEEIKVDPELSTSIFRIFQEALTNVARHARATKVKVRLNEKNGKLIMKVKDNGRGITEEEIYSPDSLGLVGMRERISPWEGQIKITGTKDRGTTLSVTLPLKMGTRSKRAKSIPKQKPGS
jgi:two-component system sensor histidine kinase UhpB